jgi:Zn-dependent protease
MTDRLRCASCATELPDGILACPACGALVHAARLRELAQSADALTTKGELQAARDTWQQALLLLPASSGQARQISSRVADLTRRIADAPAVSTPEHTPNEPRSWWKGGLAGGAALVSLLLGKLKFLALGLMKAKTLFSMLAFFGVYWTIYGWPLAAGLAISIYIHEMGHVSVLRRLGIAADAPLFIPGVGALVMLKQHIDDPVVDARIGLAGPLWGLGAGLAALAVFVITRIPIWGAIAELTGFINLFNLIPIWQLDGSRGFHALSQWQRLTVVGVVALALFATGQGLLIILGLVAVFRAFQKTATTAGDMQTLVTFVVLVGALSWLARGVGN